MHANYIHIWIMNMSISCAIYFGNFILIDPICENVAYIYTYIAIYSWKSTWDCIIIKNNVGKLQNYFIS